LSRLLDDSVFVPLLDINKACRLSLLAGSDLGAKIYGAEVGATTHGAKLWTH
jgi:hypothetical protein